MKKKRKIRVKNIFNIKVIILFMLSLSTVDVSIAQRPRQIKGAFFKAEAMEELSVNSVSRQEKGYSDNRILVYNQKLKKYGYTDTLGKIIIPFMYVCADDFNDGFAFVSTKQLINGMEWSVITSNNRIVSFQRNYNYIDMFDNRLIIFYNNSISIYDVNHNLIIGEERKTYLKKYRKYVFDNRKKFKFWNHPLLQ